MKSTRDALSEFLEALADPRNHEIVWDEAKGELHVRQLARPVVPSSPRGREKSPRAVTYAYPQG